MSETPLRHEALRQEGGFTLLELMIAMLVLVIGITSATATLASSGTAERTLRERQIVIQAANDFIDQVLSTDFFQVIPAYRPGGTPGPTFAVPIFEATTSGRIDFFFDETARDADLPMPLGFPRDLDGDGLATNTNASVNPQVIVAVVTVSWGRAGSLQFWRAPIVIRRTG